MSVGANRSQYGKVCHGVLSRDWAPSMSIRSVLDNVYGLLLSPDQGDSLDSKLALLAYNDFESYKALVKPSGEASLKSREDWLRELDQGAICAPLLLSACCDRNVLIYRAYNKARYTCRPHCQKGVLRPLAGCGNEPQRKRQSIRTDVACHHAMRNGRPPKGGARRKRSGGPLQVHTECALPRGTMLWPWLQYANARHVPKVQGSRNLP